MIQEKIGQDDLLYHAVHGLCRVDQVMKENRGGKSTVCYTLVPKVMEKMKIRYVMAADDLADSGFHLLISTRDANKILDYFKKGDIKALPDGVDGSEDIVSFAKGSQPWILARAILSSAMEDPTIRYQRKREILARAVKGLVGELSHVLQISLKDTAALIRKSLAQASRVNPQVLAELARAVE